MVSCMHFRSFRHQVKGRGYSRYWGSVFGFASIAWLVSAFIPTPYAFYLWAVGLGAIFTAPFRRQSRVLDERYPRDEEHLRERYGLLTIIVLGESFVKVLASLNGQVQWTLMAQAILALIITSCLWWIYFDDVAGACFKKERLAGVIWFFCHLPLQIGITASGVAIKKAVIFDLATVAPEKYRWLLCGSLALALMGTAAIDSVTERHQAELSDKIRVNVRIFSGVLMILASVIGGAMNSGSFLALVTFIMVAQVLFDMIMAPLEAHTEVEATPIAEMARRRADRQDKTNPPRPNMDRVVRKGTPNELRKDIYFFLMEGSWTRVVVTVLLAFLASNVCFAALYLFQPDAISMTHHDSFADAFFFSVQTMSTIGYGTMSPETTYGHIIVTIEAAVGLLGVALVTGMMFAKASKPRASVLFSKPVLISQYQGKPTLVFRLGNARGNELVDANLQASILTEEVSSEGHHLRRILDLELVRNQSPFFFLTWTVMHVLDENSPLFGVDWQHPERHLSGLVVILTGHDGTYGQKVHARHIYYPDDIHNNRHFVDVLAQLPDGRLMVDYARFHETETDTPSG